MIRLLHDWIRVRKCVNDHIRNDDGSVLLYRTDYDHDTTWFAEIIDVGPECRIVLRKDIGGKVLLPEMHNDLKRLIGEDFVVRERSGLIQFIVD